MALRIRVTTKREIFELRKQQHTQLGALESFFATFASIRASATSPRKKASVTTPTSTHSSRHRSNSDRESTAA